VASDEEIRRWIEEIEKARREIRNSKLKVKRRIKKMEKTFDPMERQENEFEIELLKRKIQRWEIVETKLCNPIVKVTANLFEMKAENKIDWSKAGKA
jgi:hypothetical protein